MQKLTDIVRSRGFVLLVGTVCSLLAVAPTGCDGGAVGDGDGDASVGDGDGDASVGDGDGDASVGDGDGDASVGDGDGDVDPNDPWGGLTGPFDWSSFLPLGFPVPRVPENNPITYEKVRLGRLLFYSRDLSGNGTQSCADCHHQEKAFTDAAPVSEGSTGVFGARSAMNLTNVAYNISYTWANPALTTLEQQVLVPMHGEFPVELGVFGEQTEQAVLARFRGDEVYEAMFAAAFPDDDEPIVFGNMARAVASFVRILISGNSPFDKFTYQGQSDAMSESAKRGMDLFYSEVSECHHCHGGFNFTLSTTWAGAADQGMPFHNTGLYNLDGHGAYPAGGGGLYEITGLPEDMGMFRAPTLRNIALTAPFQHDGSEATLEGVIANYQRGGRLIEDGPNAGDGSHNPHKSGFVPGFEATEQDLDDLKAFLESLTDESFLSDPRFSNPFDYTVGQKEDGSFFSQP